MKSWLLILILFVNIYANQDNDLKLFTTTLQNHSYSRAMDIYSNYINTQDVKPFQQKIYQTINSLISLDIDNAEILTNKFLQIEYNDKRGMYLLAKILYLNEDYTTSLKILYDLKNGYLNDELNKQVNRYATKILKQYIRLIEKQKNFDNLINLKVFLTQYDDTKNIKIIDNILKQATNKIIIPLHKYGTHYLIDIKIQNKQLKLLLDTGATTTSINHNVLINLSYTSLQHLKLSTANGVTDANLVMFDNIQIGKIKLKDFKIVVLKDNLVNFDGLLVMNFFKKYKFFIDQDKNELILSE